MNNIKQCLNSDGVFIVTSWLNSELKNLFYERSRTIEEYLKEFKGWEFSDPRRFRDKYIFATRK